MTQNIPTCRMRFNLSKTTTKQKAYTKYVGILEWIAHPQGKGLIEKLEDPKGLIKIHGKKKIHKSTKCHTESH